MKLTGTIYPIIIKLYKTSPFKKQICLFLRNFNFFSKNKLHVDLKFKGESIVKIPNTNVRFTLNCWDSTIENEIFWNGLGETWEPETVDLWISLCEKSKVIFDIGANTGIYSLIARSLNKDNEIIPNDCYNYLIKPKN